MLYLPAKIQSTMKNNYAMALVAFFMFMGVHAQFVDDIESYPTGSIFTERWTTWNGLNDGLQNAEVSTEFAASGAKSIKIGPGAPGPGPQDAILDFQGVATSGIWNAKWLMYIPSGHSAYFNVQGNTNPNAEVNSQYLSGNITFNAENATPGTAFDDNSTFEFSFPHDEWFLVGIEVDLDFETLTLRINNDTAEDFPFYDFAERFDGIDFFSIDDFALFYVDNVEFSQGPLVLETVPPVARCMAPFSVDLGVSGEVFISPEMIDNGSTDNSGEVTLSLDVTSFDCSDLGDNTVTLTVTDPSGNTDQCTTMITVTDTTAPTVTCLTSFTVLLDETGTGTVAATTIDNGSFDACGIATRTLDKTTFDCTDLGDTTVTLTVTDVNGNSAMCTTTVTVEPLIQCPSNINISTDPGTCMVSNLVLNEPVVSEGCSTIASITNDAPSEFNLGTVIVNWTIEYNSGAIFNCSQSVTVFDGEAPTTECGEDITVTVANGALYTVPDFTANGQATIQENCGLSSLGQTPTAGTMLAPGTQTVSIFAQDNGGNFSSCEFQLTVEETLGSNSYTTTAFQVYPNPTEGVLYVANPENLKIHGVYLYDISGRKVQEQTTNVSESAVQLNVGSLTNGIYLMTIETETFSYTQKVVKK
tara:strand:- start:831 stop:2759 length:1929 start_codon:yes stop_codon:yes gene_type:complete